MPRGRGTISAAAGGTADRLRCDRRTRGSYVPRQRLVVLTDIATEPDDQMSMVRLLVYSNELDIEGLVATTSTWMRAEIRPDVLHTLVERYAEVHPTLRTHAPGFPDPASLKSVIASGQTGFGMDRSASAR